MEFIEISEGKSVFPGEYLLYVPRQKVVVCGAFKPIEGRIRALVDGQLIEDKISNFKKIKLDKAERKSRAAGKGCGGCKRQ
tara:strand:+ start:1082 stop:1324 length:243 start_codon:yes stop_codon:yes gene_type:complete